MTKYALPPLVKNPGGSWTGLLDEVRRKLVSAHGASAPTKGTVATTIPVMTNREAVALVMGWRALAMMNRDDEPFPQARFPLWYTFVAHAYGWPDAKKFDVSAKRADVLYESREAAELLWANLFEIAAALEHDRKDVPVEIEFDEQDFTDTLVQNETRAALAQDGDWARAQFPIPIPNPKDPTDDPVIVDDPITVTLKKLFGVLTHPVVLVAVVALAASHYGNKSRRGRKRRR